MNVLNILLAIVLIFGLGPIPSMGIAGAALSTVLSRLAASIVGVWLLYSGRNVVRLRSRSYRPDWRLMKQILTIGSALRSAGHRLHGHGGAVSG